MFVLIHKKKTGSVFPTFCHGTFHHALITAAMCPEGGTFLNVRSGYNWFKSRPRDQESINDSPFLVE